MAALTERQRQVLEAIQTRTEELGKPPTVREIGDAVGLASTCSVQRQLESLERQGLIRRNRGRWRGVEVVDDPPEPGDRRDEGVTDAHDDDAIRVPVLGGIVPEQEWPLPRAILGEGRFYIVRMPDDCMVGRNLFRGDYLVVRRQEEYHSGEIVAAVVGEDTVVRTLHNEAHGVRLDPESPAASSVSLPHAVILGRVVLNIRLLAQ